MWSRVRCSDSQQYMPYEYTTILSTTILSGINVNILMSARNTFQSLQPDVKRAENDNNGYASFA